MVGSVRTLALVALFLAVAAVLVTPMFMGEADAPSVDEGLVDDYGYADYIISDGGRNSVSLTYRVPSDDGDGYGWAVRSLTAGSGLNLVQLSEASGSLTVVMLGGTLGNLSLVQADTVDYRGTLDVRFEMYGGVLSDLRVLTVPSYLESDLEDSYTLMFEPLGQVELDLMSGSIGDLTPTEDMVSADSLTVTISEGMTIDRMYATGTNGRYSSVDIILRGGSVGYMTNDQSVVGRMHYIFDSGSVDYFCIGADTENGSNNYLSGLNTFYVQDWVGVYVDESVSIRQAIIGAGIIEAPTVLWNGSSATVSPSRDIVIDAPGMPLSPDTCFMTSNRSQGNVYQFTSYTVDGTPRTKSMSSTYYVNGSSVSHEVYGPDGVWASSCDLTIGVGRYLYLDADVTVHSGTVLTVEAGGRLVTSGHIYLYGVMDIMGDVVNSGIIEKREGGSVTGSDPIGDGFVAYCINVSPSDGRIDVMASDDDTVVLRTDGTVYISHISVLLENGDREVTVTAPESLYIGGDQFIISLREVTGGNYVSSYDLEVLGIDKEVFGSMTTEITIPCALPSDTECYVYHLVDGEYVPMEIQDRSFGEITFLAQGTGQYYLSTVSPEGVDGQGSDGLDENTLNIILAVIIVVVGAAVVYILLKKD